MPNQIPTTDTLANFAHDPRRFLAQLRESGQPMLLTEDGGSGVVVQDAASFQHFLEKIEQLETIAAVKESLEDVAAGRTRPIREALAELATKYQIPPVQDE
ncbi:MAG: hypothetical protein K2R98_28060 [Gemmataceae bacterium]|nr:hypothetical protein [Gemmataceae bacterium]